jgi:HK97 family phage major capsid protein
VFNDEGCATMATGTKVILVGDFSYYTLAERKQISISRNPYLYQANGQVGFFSNFRFGGAVTQAEAFQYGTMA